MNAAAIRVWHRWLFLFVGVQMLLCMAGGFYMVAVHIDIIHGDDLVSARALIRNSLFRMRARCIASWTMSKAPWKSLQRRNLVRPSQKSQRKPELYFMISKEPKSFRRPGRTILRASRKTSAPGGKRRSLSRCLPNP